MLAGLFLGVRALPVSKLFGGGVPPTGPDPYAPTRMNDSMEKQYKYLIMSKLT